MPTSKDRKINWFHLKTKKRKTKPDAGQNLSGLVDRQSRNAGGRSQQGV